MGIQNVVRWASLEINYPGVSSPSQPWLGGPVQVAPASDYWSPNVKPPAQNFNYLFAKEDAQSQYAYNLAVSVAVGNWLPETGFNGIVSVTNTPINWAGFGFDEIYGRWIGCYLAQSSGPTNHIQLAETFDGGRTWTQVFVSATGSSESQPFAMVLSPTNNSLQVVITSGASAYAHSIASFVDTPVALSWATACTQATAFAFGGYLWALIGNQTGGTFSAWLSQGDTATGAVWSNETSTLPVAWQSGTNHLGALLSATGSVGGTATAVMAICGATAGTDTAKLLKMTVVAGVPTCTDITPTLPSYPAAVMQICGLTYGANDGLWGLAVNDGGGGNSAIFTSPDLTTWTAVYATGEGIIQGLAVVGNVWATSLNNGASTQVLISGNVGSLFGSSTWSPTSMNLANILADGYGGLFSNGNQLLAASDIVVVASLQVGFDNDTPAAPFAEPFGNAASSARTVFVYNNVDGVLPATTGDLVIAFEGLTGPHQATLPATPAVGQEAIVVDADGSLASHNFTVVGNGNNINGASTPLVMTAADPGADGSVSMIFISAAIGWRRV